MLYNIFELVNTKSVSSHINKSSDYCSYHVSEKSVSSYVEILVAMILVYQWGWWNVAGCGFVISASLTECFKISYAQKICSSLIHGFKIERISHFNRIISTERYLSCVNKITVCA